MTTDKPKFNVVFEYTAAAGAYQGIRTWTPYVDENDFRRKYEGKSPEYKAREVPVEPLGVTEREAIRMCASVPLRTQLRAELSKSFPEGTPIEVLDALADTYLEVKGLDPQSNLADKF